MTSIFDYNQQIVETQIAEQDYFFYMRTADQVNFDTRQKTFIEDRFRYAYLLDDMAGLISSVDIGSFLRYHADLFRSNRHNAIERSDLDLIKTFINDAYKQYLETDFIDLQDAQISC